MESTAERDRGPRRQWFLLGGVFAAVVALLVLGYFLFLRTDYVVLADGLRPSDSSTIVAELDKRGTPYRLSNGGTTILVPEDRADATRVAIAGSDAAARGQIGFELFNKSDMGLTNFAQKINFQRALQGELVRTITMMDGVADARVHLAIPERTLFRGDRADPTAAVTIAMKPGQTAEPSRVAGIQRLVAAAVPDLPQSKVVVLDSSGRVISQEVAEAGAQQPADLEERAAIEGYYRARARAAVEQQLPGVRFALRILLLPIASDATPATNPMDASAAPSGDWTPLGEGTKRNFRLRVMFITQAALPNEDQTVAQGAIAQALALNTGLGDSVAFETGPIDPIPAAAPPISAASREAIPVPHDTQPTQSPSQWPPAWVWGVVALALVALLLWRLRNSGAARLGDEDHEAFAARLRRQLNLEDGADAVA